MSGSSSINSLTRSPSPDTQSPKEDSLELTRSSTVLQRKLIVSEDPPRVILQNLKIKHADLAQSLETVLNTNPEIRASERGQLALFQAMDQNLAFKKIVADFLKNPIVGAPTGGNSNKGYAVDGNKELKTPPATGSWAVQEAMEALSEEHVHFNRSELGFLIGSIALDQEPKEAAHPDLFADWDTK